MMALNQMGKHLAVLRSAGLVQVVPETFRRTDSEGRLILNVGMRLLRFGDEVLETVSLTV